MRCNSSVTQWKALWCVANFYCTVCTKSIASMYCRFGSINIPFRYWNNWTVLHLYVNMLVYGSSILHLLNASMDCSCKHYLFYILISWLLFSYLNRSYVSRRRIVMTSYPSEKAYEIANSETEILEVRKVVFYLICKHNMGLFFSACIDNLA